MIYTQNVINFDISWSQGRSILITVLTFCQQFFEFPFIVLLTAETVQIPNDAFLAANDINAIIKSKLHQDKPREKGSIQTF